MISKSPVIWGYAPEWANFHAFDDPSCQEKGTPTGGWWSHRPQRFPGKCYWENPNSGDVFWEPSGFALLLEPVDSGEWKYSVEGRPAVIRPVIVCLCGSTRFWREFQRAGLVETMAGKIVLSIGAASGTDDDHFGNLPREEYDRVKEMLDQLHLRKIDLADEVLILNVGQYVGESTARELAYAQEHGKRVRFLEPRIEQIHSP